MTGAAGRSAFVAAMFAVHPLAVADRASFPFAGRVANALQACLTYVIQMVWLLPVAGPVQVGRHALDVMPDNYYAHENLGLLLAAQGRTSEAIDQYHEALRVAPNRLQTHILLGNVLLETGRAEESVAQYRETLRLEGDSAEVRNLLAAVLKKMGQADSPGARPTVRHPFP
jgi:tetratricopeptide (TPR) repeat protein